MSVKLYQFTDCRQIFTLKSLKTLHKSSYRRATSQIYCMWKQNKTKIRSVDISWNLVNVLNVLNVDEDLKEKTL